MRKLIAAFVVLSALYSCGTATNTSSEAAPEEMYNWGGGSGGVTEYERLTYENYKRMTAGTKCELLCYYSKLIKNPTGARKLPPPGICAEFGYLLLLPDTPSLFDENATEEQKLVLQGIDFRGYGLEMLKKELEMYPESSAYISPLLKKASENLSEAATEKE